MEYNLFRIVSTPTEAYGDDEKTFQMYKGDDLREIANQLKQVIQTEISAENKILEPDLKTRSEIFSTEGTVSGGNFITYAHYHITATKGTKTAPWGDLNPDEYTEFILDMKRWIKNKYKPDEPTYNNYIKFKNKMSNAVIPQYTEGAKYIIS